MCTSSQGDNPQPNTITPSIFTVSKGVDQPRVLFAIVNMSRAHNQPPKNVDIFPFQNPHENSCTVCKNLQLGSHETQLPTLRESMKAGCQSCAILCLGTRQANSEDRGSIEYQAIAGTALSVSVTSYNDHSEYIPTTYMKFYTPSWKNCPWASIGYSRGGFVEALDANESINQLKSWIENCQQNHPKCSTRGARLPTRVIDVGEQDGGRQFLHISNGAVADYVALSHCWGQVTHLKTTRDSLEERMKGLEWNMLSQTFQDAIISTGTLGLRYLWIDSLCILQDDVEDWELESGRMADVYSGAYVVFGATYSPDGSMGFFARAKQKMNAPFFHGFAADNTIYEIYRRPELESLLC
jgi:Pyruvate/2-oxoacid:ferredoxin oxidoreductase delta subunit